MDRITAAARAINRVYEHAPVGGSLHVAIDDGNLDDGNLDGCLEYLESGEYLSDLPSHRTPTAADLEAERECYRLLRALTEDERFDALEAAQEMEEAARLRESTY